VFIFTGEDQKSVEEMAKSMETFAGSAAGREGVFSAVLPESLRLCVERLYQRRVRKDSQRAAKIDF